MSESKLTELSRKDGYRVLVKGIPEPIKEDDEGRIGLRNVTDMPDGTLVVESIPRPPEGDGIWYEHDNLNDWLKVSSQDPGTKRSVSQREKKYLASISTEYSDKTGRRDDIILPDHPQEYGDVIIPPNTTPYVAGAMRRFDQSKLNMLIKRSENAPDSLILSINKKSMDKIEAHLNKQFRENQLDDYPAIKLRNFASPLDGNHQITFRFYDGNNDTLYWTADYTESISSFNPSSILVLTGRFGEEAKVKRVYDLGNETTLLKVQFRE